MIEYIDKKVFIKKLQEKKGIPFRHRGRTKTGLDCVGLLSLTLSELGESIFDKKVYGREPRNDGLKEMVDLNLGSPIYTENNLKIELLETADIVLIKFKTEPHHVAVINSFMEEGKRVLTIIHAHGEAEKVVEHRLDTTWFNRITHVYRIKDKQC